MAETLAQHFRALKTKDQILIGLTGGIGSGKSTVAALIREAGYTVLSSDDIAKEIMATNEKVQREMVEAFGEQVCDEDGRIDRALLAEYVFGDTVEHQRALAKLNAIVHPYVIDDMATKVRELYTQGERCVFNESALLFEANLAECYDYVIVVDAPEDVRIARLQEHRAMTREAIMRRIGNQMPAEEKKGLADFVVDNSATASELKVGVQALLAFVPLLAPK